MELDDMKTAWQALDHRLDRHYALDLQQLRETRHERMRTSLRPLFWGQLVQMLFGLAMLLLGVACWTANRDVPLLLGAGLVLHAYGIVVMVASGVTLGLMRGIDYGAPVLAIQKQLARLRRCYVISGMVTGLPWWVMWMMPVIVLAGSTGNAAGLAWLSGWLVPSVVLGVAGLLGTWWFHRWARRPGRDSLARRLDDSLSGASLRRAQAALDEIHAFERG